MKSLAWLLISGLFAVSLTPFVYATDDSDLRLEKRDKRVAILKEECVTGKASENCITEPEQVLTGEVEEIDYATGTLVLNHRGARFTLHLPPASIADIKKGDTVAIPLTEKPGP